MKLASTLFKYFLGIAAVCLVVITLFPCCRSRVSARNSSCQSNLKQIGLAFRQYSQDYDKRLPLSQTSSSSGWADSLQLYAKSWEIFNCPENRREIVGNLTDYFYNQQLAGAKLKTISFPSVTILAGDGNLDASSYANISSLPQGWHDYRKSPAYRHMDGANYVFVDGHAKWFKHEKVTAKKPHTTDDYTFLPR